MADIAVSVTVFKRIEKLNELLRSIDPAFVSVVYIADNGELTERKNEVYNQSLPFELEVFDLEYDVGLGASRNKIVQEFEEEYLLLMDSDMRMPKNAHILLEQLEANSEIGGVCGAIAETDRIFTSGCLDIYEDGDTISLDLRDKKEVQFLAGYPFIEFDMITNASLFRRECVKEYSWDPKYQIGREHADFFLGHKRRTDWIFGFCPTVHFFHNPGGSEEYLSNRWDDEKYHNAEEYLIEKWGFNEYNQIDDNWLDCYDPVSDINVSPRVINRALNKYRTEGGVSVIKSTYRFLQP